MASGRAARASMPSSVIGPRLFPPERLAALPRHIAAIEADVAQLAIAEPRQDIAAARAAPPFPQRAVENEEAPRRGSGIGAVLRSVRPCRGEAILESAHGDAP
jgi:hypothetical protein